MSTQLVFFDDEDGAIVLKGAVVELKNNNYNDIYSIVHDINNYGYRGLSFRAEIISKL